MAKLAVQRSPASPLHLFAGGKAEGYHLEIGTGSGYQAAVLAEIAREVYTIEIVAPLADRARATLDRLGYRNIRFRTGDGYRGWPEAAPFDAILVTAAPPRIPPPLEESREAKDVVDSRGEARAFHPLERPKEAEVVVCRELLVEGQLLRHEAETPLRRVGVAREDRSVDLHASGVGREQAADDRDRRRLTGPVRPEEPDDLPLSDRQRHAVDRGDSSVGLAEGGQLQGGDHARTREGSFMVSTYGGARGKFGPPSLLLAPALDIRRI